MPPKRIPAASGEAGESSSKSQSQKPKRHECSVCHQRFRRAEHMKRHFRRHTLERPYRCCECGMCFSRKELHKRHQTNFHGYTSSYLPSPEILPELGSEEALAIVQPLSYGRPHPSDIRNNGMEISAKNHDTPQPEQIEYVQLHSQEHEDPRRDSQASFYHTPASTYAPNISPSAVFHDSHLTNSLNEGAASSTNTEDTMAASNLLGMVHDFQPPGSELFNNSFQPPSLLNGNNFQLTPDASRSPLQESHIWQASLDSVYASDTPSQFMSTMTPISNIFQDEANHYFPISIQTSDSTMRDLRARIQDVLFQSAAHKSDALLAVPDANMLNRYWKTFFTVPDKDIRFIHEASTSIGHSPPALILVILGDGAMRCGEKDMGMMLLECSRRLISQHLDSCSLNCKRNSVPLWIIQTLLVNAMFGIPGGGSIHPYTTVGSLECLMDLALQTEIEANVPLNSFPLEEEEEWARYIHAETRRRLFVGVGVIARLWSVIYNISEEAVSRFWKQIGTPLSDRLWFASSATNWKEISLEEHSNCTMPRLRTVVHSLFHSIPTTSGRLASMSQIFGLLVHSDDLRNSSSIPLFEIKEHFEIALSNWTSAYYRNDHSMALPFTILTFIRVSLHVEIKVVMKMFVEGSDYSTMRGLLRQGNLQEASRHALTGLIPWAAKHKNHISMLSLCFSLIVFETSLLLSNAAAVELCKTLSQAVGISMDPNVPATTAIWLCLRRIVENGPMTTVLLSAMNKYSDYANYELRSQRGM